MYQKILVNLGSLVLSRSDALDLAFSSLAMHPAANGIHRPGVGKTVKVTGKKD
jgi:hypothetical protein